MGLDCPWRKVKRLLPFGIPWLSSLGLSPSGSPPGALRPPPRAYWGQRVLRKRRKTAGETGATGAATGRAFKVGETGHVVEDERMKGKGEETLKRVGESPDNDREKSDGHRTDETANVADI